MSGKIEYLLHDPSGFFIHDQVILLLRINDVANRRVDVGVLPGGMLGMDRCFYLPTCVLGPKLVRDFRIKKG